MALMLERCDHIGGCQPIADDKHTITGPDDVERTGLCRIGDEARMIGKRFGQAGGRRGRRVGGGDDENVGNRLPAPVVGDMPVPAAFPDLLDHRTNVPHRTVSDERLEVGMDVVSKDASARKYVAVRPACLLIPGYGVMCFQPPGEMIGFVGQQAHPRGWHVDPVRRVGRVVGQPLPDRLARFEDENVRTAGLGPRRKMIGDGGAGKAAADNGDGRPALNRSLWRRMRGSHEGPFGDNEISFLLNVTTCLAFETIGIRIWRKLQWKG